MLASRRKISFQGENILTTPLLVPSFSSKGFPDVQKIIETTQEAITDVILVSAYDISYDYVIPALDFAQLVFLDSGGYEASKSVDFSDLGYGEHEPSEWTVERYHHILASWSCETPTVAVSYDHPKHRVPFNQQVAEANSLYESFPSFVREILIKPETSHQKYIQPQNIIAGIHQLAAFDIIGFTEKELGSSVLERMIVIGKIRTALSEAGITCPIHIFGSLDTISTPLYFIAGADIFDGLTWLRFAYMDGLTCYLHNYSALKLGVQLKDHLATGRIWFNNYYELKELEMNMKRFLNAGDYMSFRQHSRLIETAHESLIAKLEE